MKKLKSIMAIVLMGVMLMGIMSFLFGCSFASDPLKHPDQNRKEDQGFSYIVSKDETETTAIILGLAGIIDREELIIPEKLGGYRVKRIGYYIPPQIITSPGQFWGLDAEGISRIIINSNVSVMKHGISRFNGIVFLNYPNLHIPRRDTNCDVNFEPNGGTVTNYSYSVFYKGTIPKPKDPVKENATFLGWFKDKELTQEWNFETDIVNDTSDGTWLRTVDLYAKWSK